MLAFKRKQSNSDILPFKYAHQLNQLPTDVIQEIINASEGRLISKLVPSLKEKFVATIAQNERPFIREVILSEKPKEHIQLLINKSPQDTSIKTIIIDEILAVKPNSIDVIVLNTGDMQKDFWNLLQESSNKLKPDGLLLLTVVHPCLEILLKNQNPDQQSIMKRNIQDYIQFMRENNMYLENFKESLVTQETKTYFTLSKNTENFNDYIGVPLVAGFRFVKYV